MLLDCRTDDIESSPRGHWGSEPLALATYWCNRLRTDGRLDTVLDRCESLRRSILVTATQRDRLDGNSFEVAHGYEGSQKKSSRILLVRTRSPKRESPAEPGLSPCRTEC